MREVKIFIRLVHLQITICILEDVCLRTYFIEKCGVKTKKKMHALDFFRFSTNFRSNLFWLICSISFLDITCNTMMFELIFFVVFEEDFFFSG